MDYGSVLLDPIYATLGVAGTLMPNSPGAEGVSVLVINKTDNVEVSAAFQMETVRPAAAVRTTEILNAGIALGDLDGGTLVFSGQTWRIDSHMTRPSPMGDGTGEVWMYLYEEAAGA